MAAARGGMRTFDGRVRERGLLRFLIEKPRIGANEAALRAGGPDGPPGRPRADAGGASTLLRARYVELGGEAKAVRSGPLVKRENLS